MIKGVVENMEKREKIGMIIAGITLLLVIVVVIAVIFINQNNKEDLKDDDNDTLYTAENEEEFINYLNQSTQLIADKDEINVVYKNIKYKLSNKIDEKDDSQYFVYDIYSNDKMLEKDDSNRYGNNIKGYLLQDNDKKAFLLVSEITPVGSSSEFNVTVFDINGNLLLDETYIEYSTGEIGSDFLSFSYETKMQESFELDIRSEQLENYCEYLSQDYDEDYVVRGSKKYRYLDGELSLVENNTVTIKDYKEKYSCN